MSGFAIIKSLKGIKPELINIKNIEAQLKKRGHDYSKIVYLNDFVLIQTSSFVLLSQSMNHFPYRVMKNLYITSDARIDNRSDLIKKLILQNQCLIVK